MSLLIREMQIKTTMSYHLTLIRIGIIKKSGVNKCWRESGEKGNYTIGRNVNWCSHFGKQFGDSLKKKFKIELLYDPAIPLLGLYLEKKLEKIHATQCS